MGQPRYLVGYFVLFKHTFYIKKLQDLVGFKLELLE